ncbi:hypothetical protein QBC46DRAFT_458544 [Diplogelasinospora grovesii]|uniref:Uncharacterized protein n=1 Tax=Diplogelasinospora grovesii TaxID=303347 RepID=A0AAN6N8D3_9PEZI|nr:hypothetical protein QBC46DRAFT_458544 [Diplogelasinospora grovesii]
MGLLDDTASLLSTGGRSSHSKHSKSHHRKSSSRHYSDRDRDAKSHVSSRSNHHHHHNHKSSRSRSHSREGRDHSRTRPSKHGRGGGSVLGGFAASVFGGRAADDDDDDGFAYGDHHGSYDDRHRTTTTGSSRGFFGRSDEYKKNSSSSSSKASFFNLGNGNGNASRGSFFGFGGGGGRSPSYYKRSPRPNFVSRVVRRLKRLLRDLVYYAKRNPIKVFMLVIMPLITGGALTALLARFGLRVPHAIERMLGLAGKAATGDSIGLVGEAVRMASGGLGNSRGGYAATRTMLERGREGGMQWERRSVEKDAYGRGAGGWGDGLKGIAKIFS